MNGLDISLEQFKRMRAQDRDELIYKNLVYIRKNQTDNKFHNKIQYTCLGILSLLNGIRKWIPL